MREIKKKVFIVLLMSVAFLAFSGNVCAADNRLDNPVITEVKATSDSRIKLTWTKVKGAETYHVYRSTSRNGNYREIASTGKLKYTDQTGKQLKTYYYKICASCGNGDDLTISKYSKGISAKVRKRAKKILYVGDSVMSGFSVYGIIKNTKSHKVISKIGVNTPNFYKSSLMSSVLSYNPDRMYIMLGMNGLPGKSNSSYQKVMVDYYKKILKKCLKKNPDMEIIVVGVSPTGRGSSVSMSNVKAFNKKLKKMTKPYDTVYYMDLTPVLGDGSGYLKKCYNGGDGIHWKKAAYQKVFDAFKKFAREF